MTKLETSSFRKAMIISIAIALLLVTPTAAFHSNWGFSGSTSVDRDSDFQRINHGYTKRDFGLALSAENDESDNVVVDDNGESSSVVTNLMKDTKDLTVSDWIVAKRDVPSLGIRSGAVYKILSIFLKGASGQESLGVEVIPLETYGDDESRSSYTKYLKVYNPRDHDKMDSDGVVVTPEEIGLVSVKADWTEALFLAVPGFFWVFVAMAFSNYYTDRYGGSFFDAFFRT